jgi:hypothetical protein
MIWNREFMYMSILHIKPESNRWSLWDEGVRTLFEISKNSDFSKVNNEITEQILDSERAGRRYIVGRLKSKADRENDYPEKIQPD